MANLQEVKAMLAETSPNGPSNGSRKASRRAWRRGWRGCVRLCSGRWRSRFGAVPESVREKEAALDSFEEIAGLIVRTATASSLATMDL